MCAANFCRRSPGGCATTRSCGSSCAWASAACTTPTTPDRELHAVYPLISITHNRRVRLEVAAPDGDPHIPSLFGIYPTNDWHERETYDFFGIIFDGHPSLTRIEMPDDWEGHPQRKDYPLGGVPVEYKGAKIPPPDRAEVLQLMSDTTAGNGGNGTDTLIAVSGQDWDKIVEAARSKGEPGERIVVNMGPQHPSTHGVLRSDPRDRGRDRHRRPLRNRLPAHRNREEPRVPLLDAGRHVRDPNGLPVTVFQRDRILPRRGEAARHHRRDPGTGQRHPGDDDGAQPHLLAPGRVGHRRHGTGRDDADVLRLQGPRDHPDAVRVHHRPADEQRLHSARAAWRRTCRPTRRPKSPRPSRN